MKRYRGWVVLLILIALCMGGVWLILRATAEYPPLAEPVSYSVNQVDGFVLTIEKPTWSPFRGYTIRWNVATDSKEVYHVSHQPLGFEYLECCIEEQWYRLGYTQDDFPFTSLEFSLGGDASNLQGSIVQKYDGYGTRLEAGTYRLVLEMTAEDGTPYYLAKEFDID